MAGTLKLTPGSIIRWRAKRFSILDYVGVESVIARELGKHKLERIRICDITAGQTPGDQSAWTPDLVSIPEEAWQKALRRFKMLRPLLEMDPAERTLEKIQNVAEALDKHPATVYRWMAGYERSQSISVFLRKGRSDRGKTRLSNKADAIIKTAIKKIYASR